MTTHALITTPQPALVDYGQDVETAISALQEIIEENDALGGRYPSRWLAIKLLEEDDEITAQVAAQPDTADLLARADKHIAYLKDKYGEDVDILIADHRYSWIHHVVGETVHRRNADQATLSDRVDQIVTNRWLGIPIFFVAMWFVFKLTTDVTAPYLDWISAALNGPVSNWTVGLLTMVGLQGTWVESLVIDGVFAGLGGVLVFVPVLMALYFCLALLEDSGYMARAAFVMDKQMRVVGLHGKSFVPLVIGFGCNVPAIYATRTLKNRRDRILTGLLVPFMSCGARLPVYILIATVFFAQYSSVAIFSMYLIGILAAIVVGLVLKKTLFKTNEETGMLMELPPYRLPTIRNIWTYTWQRTKDFLRGATTVILITSIVVWALMAIPVGGEGSFADTAVENSAFGRISGAIAPIFAAQGFGSWEATSALLSGFVAKEVVVSTLAQAYATESSHLEPAPEPTIFLEDVGELAGSFVDATVDTLKSIPLIFGINLFDTPADETPPDLVVSIRQGFEASSGGHAALAGLAFMVFVLLYTPCMVVAAAQRQEFGAKWMWTSMIGQFVIAWLVALVVFQGGLLLGIG